MIRPCDQLSDGTHRQLLTPSIVIALNRLLVILAALKDETTEPSNSWR
jgi:hypothetical protein